MFRLNTFLVILTSVLLAACGGGGGPVVPDSGTDGGTDGSTGTSPNTFYPMNFYFQGDEYVDDGNLFAGTYFSPLIKADLIAPVNASTLAPATNPSVSDYDLTINDEPVTVSEHSLVMQRVVGLPVQVRTALIIDTSPSNQVDRAAFIASVKAYIAAAQASSDTAISNQLFTIWAFGQTVSPLVSDFTDDPATLNAALDTLLIEANWRSRGQYSALYQSIVAAVGSYLGTGSVDLTNDVNYRTDGDNDLIDGYDTTGNRLNSLSLSNVVLFAAGTDTLMYFDSEKAKTALIWQSFLVYTSELPDDSGTDDEEGDDNAAPDGMTFLGKPLYYVSLGPNNVVSSVSGMASEVINTNSWSTFNFAAPLIAAQREGVALRRNEDNLYMIRFALPQRDGKSTVVLKSKSASRSYSLTTEIEQSLTAIPPVSPVAEITGPGNTYLAAGAVSASSVTRLYPAVRWDVWGDHPLSGFTWTVGGAARTAAADGSISISTSDAGDTVVLSNGSLSTSLTITN